jgi:spermidine synthase
MSNIIDFLSGTKTLEEVESPINGKITVVKSLAFGTYIQVGGLTQSGGILYDVWKKPLEKVASIKKQVARVLILGLGGGTAAKITKKLWPEAKITGVDLDPLMVEMGKKYLGLDNSNVRVFIEDAFQFLTDRQSPTTYHFDLILIDLYVGFEFPKDFESEKYIHLVKSLLANNGIAIFNRLYYGDKRSVAVKFGKKLEKVFSQVEAVYPEANIMFICHRNKS